MHQWQAHCQRCPASLVDYEKLARRKKDDAVFLIWHSHDTEELAKKRAAELDLKLPVYQGKMIKWDKEFGEFKWPHVIVYDAQGKVVYMGPHDDRSFSKILRILSPK